MCCLPNGLSPSAFQRYTSILVPMEPRLHLYSASVLCLTLHVAFAGPLLLTQPLVGFLAHSRHHFKNVSISAWKEQGFYQPLGQGKGEGMDGVLVARQL